MPKMTWDSAIALHPDRDPEDVARALYYLQSRGEILIEQESDGVWWVSSIPTWGMDSTPPTTTPPKPREPAPAVAVERVTEWLRGLQRERRISREMVKSVLAHFGASKVAELPADELENFRAIIEGEIK